jgi:GNAT superfamily N-acetyltransferase
MIFVVLSEAANKGHLLLVDGGLCHWGRHKRHGHAVIYEIIVLPERRGEGIGGRLVDDVVRLNPGRLIIAKCPVGYESNEFWRAYGFTLYGTKDRLNVWHLNPPPGVTAEGRRPRMTRQKGRRP